MKKHDLGLAIITTLVIVVIISVFNITDNPFNKQKKARDQQKLSDFSTLSSAIQTYYTKNKLLPVTLDQLDVSRYSKNLVDSVRTKKYGYQIIDTRSYNLCTTFETNTKKEQSQNTIFQRDMYGSSSSDYPDTTHTEGYYCIRYSIPSYISPSPTPFPTYRPQTITPTTSVSLTSSKVQDSGLQANWNHATSQTSTVIVMTVAYRAHTNPDAAVKTVTYATNQQFTKVRRDHYTDRTTEIWYLTNPAVGSNQISVEFTKDPESQAFAAATVNNIDTITPVAASGGTGSNSQNELRSASSSASLQTQSGDVVIGTLGIYPDGNTNTVRPIGRASTIWNIRSYDLNIQNYGIYFTAQSNTETVSWTMTKDYSRAGSFVVLRPKNRNSSTTYY